MASFQNSSELIDALAHTRDLSRVLHELDRLGLMPPLLAALTDADFCVVSDALVARSEMLESAPLGTVTVRGSSQRVQLKDVAAAGRALRIVG